MSDLWAKALQAAEAAKLPLRSGDYDGACNRAYYSMFNVARALLIERHDVQPESLKRHAAVLRQFSKHFVAPGVVDVEVGRLLRRASDMRAVAGYGEMSVQADRAEDPIDAMNNFIKAATTVRSGGE